MTFGKNDSHDLSPSHTRDDREVIHKFIQTNRLHRRIIERWADNLDLQCACHRMLMHISRADNIPSQKEISEHFKISPAAVAITLKRLEADGYVERARSAEKNDSRIKEISITEKGRRTARDMEKYFRFVDASTLEGFTDEEIDTLLSLLDRMQSNLHKIEDFSSLDERKDTPQ